MSAQITAAHVALAVVAACRMTGADPEGVFGPARGNKRVRLLAAAGLMTALRLRPKDVAGVFQVDATRLAPSMLRSADIGTDALLTIAEALRTGGVQEGGRPAVPPPRDLDRPRPAVANPVRPHPSMRAGPIQRLGAVSENMVRWSRIYLARGVSVSDLADLFDVDVEVLADHLKPELARAA